MTVVDASALAEHLLRERCWRDVEARPARRPTRVGGVARPEEGCMGGGPETALDAGVAVYGALYIAQAGAARRLGVDTVLLA